MDRIPIGTLCVILSAPDGAEPEAWGLECTVVSYLPVPHFPRIGEYHQVKTRNGWRLDCAREVLLPIDPPQSLKDEEIREELVV